MAGLCSIMILLFWAVIIGLTESPEPPQCSYTVTHNNRSVLKIEVKPPGDYNISVFEEGRPETEEKVQVYQSTQSSVWETKHLKPCTEYRHTVSFINADGKEIFCNTRENKIRTNPMSKGDIKEKSCIPEYVCYQSDWDISSSISTPDNLPVKQCSNDNKTFCVRPANKDICSDLTITFTSGTCVETSFSFTKSISVDFLNSSEIHQNTPTGLPAKIEAILPELPKCAGLSVSYTCSEKAKPGDMKELSELEPFTNYSCTGQILENNIPTNKTTPEIHFRVDCDLTITYTKKNPSDTSIELRWKTASGNCKEVLPSLQKLSYDCVCQKNGQKQERTHKDTKLPPDEGACSITGLDPYTEYTCHVQPKYNNNKIHDATGTAVRLQTKPGIPEAVRNLKLTVPEHNTIKVSWDKPNRFNGPEMKYIVTLYKAGEQQERKTLDSSRANCDFKDLSYSMTYTVEVVAFNGHHKSPSQTKATDTVYNDNAITVIRAFVTITPLFLVLVVYKIYVLKCIKSETKAESSY